MDYTSLHALKGSRCTCTIRSLPSQTQRGGKYVFAVGNLMSNGCNFRNEGGIDMSVSGGIVGEHGVWATFGKLKTAKMLCWMLDTMTSWWGTAWH